MSEESQNIDTSEKHVHVSDKNEHIKTGLQLSLEADIAAWAKLKAKVIDEELIDDDGYPTDAALELVEKWHWTDCKGLLEFIESIWHLRSWGWSELDRKDLPKDDDDYDEKGGRLLYVSTGGWSGNESIIHAFKSNNMAWGLCWIQSRRGGHYIFTPHEFKDDE